MSKYIEFTGQEFQSSSGKTEQFKSFCRMYRALIKKLSDDAGLEIIKWNNGHFYCSGFLKNKENGNFAYFSVSDVRFYRNAWIDNILVRTAKGPDDYTGGRNEYASISNLSEILKHITK